MGWLELVVAQFDIWKRAKRAVIASQRMRRFRAARPDPSLRKERLLGMTSTLSHYQICEDFDLQEVRG